jgi:hypothetical protein
MAWSGMDWAWLIGLLLFVIGIGLASFYSYRLIERTKQEYRVTQPKLKITNLSAMTAGNVLTLYPELENVGGGVAHDCTLHIGGWEGHFSIAKVYPRGSRAQKHVASIVLNPDAPIRVKPISNGYLRLRYLDRWNQKYDSWYQVAQVKSPDSPLYTVHINLDNPEVNEPDLSFWDMRKLLRAASTPDGRGRASTET